MNPSRSSLAVSGSLAHGTSCTGTRSGAVLQWEWRHWCCVLIPTPGHTCQHVWLACSRSPLYRRTRVTPGTGHTMGPMGLTVLRPTVPPIVSTAQSDHVRQCLFRFLRFPPTRPAPSCCLCGLVFLVLQTDQSSYLSSSKPPTAPRIFLALHSYAALVSIKLLVDLRIHCIVHLAQDCFLHRSSS